MDSRLLPVLALAGLVAGRAASGSRSAHRTMTVPQVLDRLGREGDWTVGDQHQEDGFIVKRGDQVFLVWIEGWGPECVNEVDDNARVARKIKKAAKAWLKDRPTYQDGVLIEDRAVLVTLRGFELLPHEIEEAEASRDEEATIELD